MTLGVAVWSGASKIWFFALLRPSRARCSLTTRRCWRGARRLTEDRRRSTVDAHQPSCQLVLDHRNVGGDHETRELVPSGLGLPSELVTCLGRITDQRVDLRRAVVVRVDLHVTF